MSEDQHLLDGKTVTLLCEISSLRPRINKKGDSMAVAVIEDLSGTLEMLIFSNVLSRMSPRLESGAICLIRGRISAREDEEPTVICQNLELADTAKAPEPAPATDEGNNEQKKQPVSTVYLRFSSESDPAVGRCSALLRVLSGRIPVHFYYADTGTHLMAPSSLFCDGSEALRSRLAAVLGEKNVVFK